MPYLLCKLWLRLEHKNNKGGISHCDSTPTSVGVSKSPTYATHVVPMPNVKL